MRDTDFRQRIIGMLGNILEHYDNALFGLLAPFIAPLFFDEKDPLTALILTYGMLPLGILMRPLGSLFFGWIGDRFGRTRALFCSLTGMAAATFAMGCLPTFREVGFAAPLFLACGRVVQSFCAAGESVGGAIFILEHTEHRKRNLTSAIYDASSIGGILIASGLVTLFSFCSDLTLTWRYLFWIGSCTAVLGVALRYRAIEGTEFLQAEKQPLLTTMKRYFTPLLSVVIVSGFSYTTYAMAFTLMNGYIPLVSSLTKTEVMGVNTGLLLLDMALLPLFGYLAQKVGRERWMMSAAWAAMLSAVPLFYLLQGATLLTVIVTRLVIVALGVAFSATYHAWSQEQVPPAARYTILSLGYALGSQLIGAPTSALCLWLYQKMGWIGSPALYLMVISGAAGLMIRRSVLQRDRLRTNL